MDQPSTNKQPELLSWEDESLPSELRRKLWLEENRATIESWNTWVEEHGLPLEEFRQF